MSSKLQITLDEEATKKYLDWASGILEAEVSDDVEPTGCSIVIKIGAPYPYPSYAGCKINGEYFEFGEADVDLV